MDAAVYGPEARHVLTFGQVARHSLPARLCADEGELSELTAGKGAYASLRERAELGNAEWYQYLRLGVPAASALALKAMGHPTPESLLEDERIAALLPDMLVRPDREYPAAFIDACESEGISPQSCEQALRRGLSTVHTTGALGTRELVSVFHAYATKGKGVPATAAAATIEDSVVWALCTGAIPLAAVLGKGRPAVHPEKVRSFLGAMRTEEDKGFFDRLIEDPEPLGDFLRALPGWRTNHGHVRKLRSVLEAFGADALALRDPLLCQAPATPEGRPAGIATARFAEDVMAACGRKLPPEHWECLPSGQIVNTGVWYLQGQEPPKVGMADMQVLRDAGLSAGAVAAAVFLDGVTPAALLSAAESGIDAALLDGAL